MSKTQIILQPVIVNIMYLGRGEFGSELGLAGGSVTGLWQAFIVSRARPGRDDNLCFFLDDIENQGTRAQLTVKCLY